MKKLIMISMLFFGQDIFSMQSRITRLKKPIIHATLINKRQVSHETTLIIMAVSGYVVTTAVDSYTLYKLMRNVNEKIDVIKTQNESLEGIITAQQKEILALKMDEEHSRQK